MPAVLDTPPTSIPTSALLFTELLEQFDRSVRNAGFTPREVPAPWDEREGRAGIRLESRHWCSPWGTDLRSAYLYSARTEIVNIMGYPAHPCRTPVFALEYVVFNGKPVVAVVDLQPVQPGGELTERVTQKARQLRDQFSARLPTGGDLPEWAREHFTATCLYSRPMEVRHLPDLETACHDYLGLWLREFLPADRWPAPTDPCGQAALHAYRSHHVQHTPGRPYLCSAFGTEWTEAYLRRFIYPVLPPA